LYTSLKIVPGAAIKENAQNIGEMRNAYNILSEISKEETDWKK
jgi:hypothetical protein